MCWQNLFAIKMRGKTATAVKVEKIEVNVLCRQEVEKVNGSDSHFGNLKGKFFEVIERIKIR